MTATPPPHPLELTGTLEPRLSRWLWLVKMFLAIPHFAVLAVLWAAFAASSLISAVAVLLTGHFPRRLFAFNAGVMRWNWRVGFYVYAALGTDRYPPFSLGRKDYPATLEIAYPERLSRGLVLVKWLIAIPHLVILGLIMADLLGYPWGTAGALSSGLQPASGYSALNLLVVFAGFFLLVTGQYPRGLFDLLMGISRWMYRVVAYVAFMRDEYPPFRLDTGSGETR